MKPPSHGDERYAPDRLVTIVVVAGIMIGALHQVLLWNLDDAGFSTLMDRLPYWDFTNLWAGSVLALDGRADALFDVEAYRAALRAMFSPALPDQEWSYPPSMLLVGVPFALLPVFPAYLLWTLGTIGLLYLAIRPFGFDWRMQIAILASPAVFTNATFGQNGALTAALLIGGLLAVPVRPILAGVLFGLLTVKPHLGILVPFCLLAGGHWRPFLAAAATALLMAALTGLLFGFDLWALFISETAPLMAAIMEAPYPQHYHANAMTAFVLARSAGAALAAAYAVQFAVTLVAICIAVWLWRPGSRIDHHARVLLTATLAIAATPYGYSYDTIPMCVAAAYLARHLARPPVLPLAVIWLYPLFAHIPNYYGIGIGIMVPCGLVAWMLYAIPDGRKASASAAGKATAS